jgi:hypothetical protein
LFKSPNPRPTVRFLFTTADPCVVSTEDTEEVQKNRTRRRLQQTDLTRHTGTSFDPKVLDSSSRELV